MEDPQDEKNIFERLETIEGASPDIKKEILSEIESIQNTGIVIDFFVDKYLKTLASLLSRT